MKKMTIYLAMFLGLAACGEESKEESTETKDQKEEETVKEDDSDSKEFDKSQWLYDIAPSGLITISNKDADLNFHALVQVDVAGLTFKKEIEPNADGVAEVNFPQDFGIDDYENPISEVTDVQFDRTTVKISANDQEIVNEEAWLPLSSSGKIVPLYSDQVEFAQNPTLPKEVGGTESKSWIKFYADKIGFHYLSAGHDGVYKHHTVFQDETVEVTNEMALADIDCRPSSARVGFSVPAVADANGDGEMEVYVAYVNSCIENEVYIAWAEQRGEVLGERRSKSNDAPEAFIKEPSNENVAKEVTKYLSEIYRP